ncbi:MAG: AzlD domain-containing protein [Pseudomonadota bacterium]
MTQSTAEIWTIIILLALGTYLIRLSFLGIIGDRAMPPRLLRYLRFTPVAVFPGIAAPSVIWPSATDGALDAPRLAAALAALVIGVWSKNVLAAIGAGVVTLYAGLYLAGGGPF